MTKLDVLKQKRFDLVQLLETQVDNLGNDLVREGRRIKRLADTNRSPEAVVASVQNAALGPLQKLPQLTSILVDINEVEQEIAAAETQQAWNDAWSEAKEV